MSKLNVRQGTVGRLVLGGNVFGWTADERTSFDVLDTFIENGGKMIDTADGYSHWVPGHSGGESETMIGNWLSSRGTRSRVLVATKVATHPDFKGMSPLNIRRAADASLQRLGTDVIDLYWAHYDDPDVPIVETAAAFSELQRAGKIRSFGLSNYTADRVAEWMRVARAENLELPTALQPHYNLVERGFEANGLRNIAHTENLAVFPYFALAKGFLTGKYRAHNDANALDASPRAGQALEYLDQNGSAVLSALDEVAARHDASVTAVSLAWVRQQPTVAAPIASARNASQLVALIESTRLELTHDDLVQLGEVSAPTPPQANEQDSAEYHTAE